MPENQKTTSKRKYSLNAAALLIVLALAYFAFAFATNTLPEPVKNALGIKNSQEQRAQEFKSSYEDRIITYTDEVYGFQVNYPVGYTAEKDPEFGTRFRATAFVPGFSSEVLDVYVSNSSFTETDFKEINDAIASQNSVQFSGKKTINGREVYLLNTRNESEFTDEIIFTRNAFYNCKAPDGQAYSAAVVFVVPEVVAPDIELADYVIASFEC